MKYQSITAAILKSAAIIGIMAGSLSAQTDDYMQIWHTSGNEDYSKLGYHMVSAGDQNLDGYDDLLATAYGDSLTYLYYGGSPMDTIPDMVFSETHLGYYKTLPLECRDLNGDGYPDIVIGGINYEVMAGSCVFLFLGGPQLDDEVDMIFLPNAEGSTGGYGQYLSMGDFNGDSNFDLIVGAPSFTDVGIGRIFIYYGGAALDTTLDFTMGGNSIDVNGWGTRVSCSGDVNNDGCDDIFTRGYPQGASEGIMLLFGGSDPDSIPDWERISQIGDFWNGHLNIIPDINGDGCDEIAYGAFSDGNAYIHYGGETINPDPDVYLYGDTWYNNRGSASAGDVNNDGYVDYMVASQYGESVYVYFLGPDLGFEKDYDLLFEGEGYGGGGLGFAGDTNNDGIGEFMFCSQDWTAGLTRGEIFIYSDPDASVRQVEPGAYLTTFSLGQNYPNPFNASTTIPFTLDRAGKVTLTVYDVLGRSVGVQYIEPLQAGAHEVDWNAEGMASGTYLVRLDLLQSAGTLQHTQVRKVVLVK